jgi:hypothetical protein
VLFADGLTVGAAPDLFEEHLQAFELFCSASTQWNIASGGFGAQYIGLNYQALQSIFWFNDIKKKIRCRLFEEIRLIEQGALSVLNKK